jgi:hypothetical protein
VRHDPLRSPDELSGFMTAAMAGDYDNLLRVAVRYSVDPFGEGDGDEE